MLCHGCRRFQVSMSSFLCAVTDSPTVQYSTHSFAIRALTRALLFSQQAFVPSVGPNNPTVAVRSVRFEGRRVVPVLRCYLEVSFRTEVMKTTLACPQAAANPQLNSAQLYDHAPLPQHSRLLPCPGRDPMEGMPPTW